MNTQRTELASRNRADHSGCDAAAVNAAALRLPQAWSIGETASNLRDRSGGPTMVGNVARRECAGTFGIGGAARRAAAGAGRDGRGRRVVGRRPDRRRAAGAAGSVGVL